MNAIRKKQSLTVACSKIQNTESIFDTYFFCCKLSYDFVIKLWMLSAIGSTCLIVLSKF